jgi:hypothetical protein
MSDKHLKSPDERFETAGKDTMQGGQPGIDKNKQKPDDAKPKGEPASTADEGSQE